MSAARTERLLNLLTLLLNSRRPVALREIREMDEFGAYLTADPKSGERAFERDKAALLALGVPLRWAGGESQDDEDDGVGGCRIDRERYFLPELHLSGADLALLSIAGAAAAALPGFPAKPAVVRALAKLGFDVEAARAAPSLAHAPLQAGIDAAQVGQHLAVLHDALARERQVALSYAAAAPAAVASTRLGAGPGKGAVATAGVGPGTGAEAAAGAGPGGHVGADPEPAPPTLRLVDPWGVYYRDGTWYLVGLCHLRGARRTFHLGRVTSVRPVGRPQAFSVPADFDLRAHARRRPWEYPLGPPVEVTVRLAPRLAPMARAIFGVGARLEALPAGVLVRLVAHHLPALAAAILPYGAAAEVLAPPALRRTLGASYAALAARHAAAA